MAEASDLSSFAEMYLGLPGSPAALPGSGSLHRPGDALALC